MQSTDIDSEHITVARHSQLIGSIIIIFCILVLKPSANSLSGKLDKSMRTSYRNNIVCYDSRETENKAIDMYMVKTLMDFVKLREQINNR